jgi:alpha-tubulin suppressor-like RCC1 family protein
MRTIAKLRPVLLRFFICMCAASVSRANDMYVVGLNDFGQLGAGDLLQRTTYSKITTPFITYISGCSGLSHSAVIGNTAELTQVLMLWGRNDRGQLGTGDTQRRLQPTEPVWSKTMRRTSDADAYVNINTPRPRFVAVACGEDSTVGVTDGGKVYSWGSNDYGQLGISDQTAEMLKTPAGLYYRSVPYFISSLQHVFVVAITAGTYHFAVLSDMGQVFLWGSNSEGQLGMGDFSQRNLPVPLTYFRTPVLQVQAGAYHTVFLDTFGHVFVCGLNSNGQLGAGQSAEAKTPNAVATIESQNITTVASGHYHVFGIAEDGVFWAWGANSFGQLGVGDAVNRFTPVPVSSGLINGEKTDFKAYSVFAGQRHSIVVTDSGDL